MSQPRQAAPTSAAQVSRVKPAQYEVQVEVARPETKRAKEDPADDPFDALARILPPSAPIAPEPVYTGPEVTEHGATSMEGVLVGEREDTLPPGYRFEDLAPGQPDVKPKDVPKPISTDEALDSLSAGFMTSTAPIPPKRGEKLEKNVTASNFAPPPVQIERPDIAVCPARPARVAPPADKKAKVTDDFSLTAGLSGPPVEAPKVAVCPFPPADKKTKVEKVAKTDEGGYMSLDALSALGDILAAPEPKPEPAPLRPEDIVSEGKLKDEKERERLGDREDSLPPEYRFTDDKFKDLPAPKPEPAMGADDALDILSGDFMTSSAAPSVHAPVITPSAPPAPQIAVCDFGFPESNVPKKPELAVCDFGLPTQPEIIACDFGFPESNVPKKPEDDFMSLDALSALGDTLAAPEPKPEPAPVRPEDIVSEGKLEDEKGVLVGEREDSLPPEYRFTDDKFKDLPAPKPEPTMDTGDALDFLSGDFMTSSAPAVVPPSAPPAQPSDDDFALDALAGDFITSSAASSTSRQLSTGTQGALDALSDTLMDTTPVSEPTPVPVKDVVKEKKLREEKLIKMGEKDDSLPPEYRPTEEDRKAMEEAKAKEAARPKKKSLGDEEALDLLSGDFSAAALPTVPAVQPMAGPVLDSLASTLLPDAPEFRQGDQAPHSSKADKPKKHQATGDSSGIEHHSGQLSTDVMPTSTRKGGKS